MYSFFYKIYIFISMKILRYKNGRLFVLLVLIISFYLIQSMLFSAQPNNNETICSSGITGICRKLLIVPYFIAHFTIGLFAFLFFVGALVIGLLFVVLGALVFIFEILSTQSTKASSWFFSIFSIMYSNAFRLFDIHTEINIWFNGNCS